MLLGARGATVHSPLYFAPPCTHLSSVGSVPGLLLRKKRREKEGHKDPLLEELNNVLESAQKQINALCDEINTTKHKQQQLTKVAEILGVSPADLAEKSDPKKEERRPGSPAPIRVSTWCPRQRSAATAPLLLYIAVVSFAPLLETSRLCSTHLLVLLLLRPLFLIQDFDHGSRTRSDSSKSANDLKTSTEPVAKTEVKAKNGSKSEADTASLAAAHPPNITKSEDVKSKSPPPPPRPDPKKSPEPRSPHLSKSADVIESSDKSRSKSPRPCPPSTKTPPKPEEPPPFDIAEVFEYYDPGSHWCEDCNAICMTLPHYLLHLHNKKHRQVRSGRWSCMRGIAVSLVAGGGGICLPVDVFRPRSAAVFQFTSFFPFAYPECERSETAVGEKDSP